MAQASAFLIYVRAQLTLSATGLDFVAGAAVSKGISANALFYGDNASSSATTSPATGPG